MSLYHTLSRRRSQTLIEVIISITLAAMVLSALLVLGAASTKTVASSLRRSQATKLAVEGIEAVRYLRDTKGFPYLINDTCYKINNSGTIEALVNCTTNNGYDAVVLESVENTFYRRIKVVESAGAGAFAKDVSVTVRWEESSGTVDPIDGKTYKSVDLNTILAKW